MADKVAAFGRGEQTERGGDQCAHVVEAPVPRRSEERLQFGKREFNRVEVRTVGWQKSDLRADRFNRGADRRLFVNDEVIEDHHITRVERRDQHLLDVGKERRIVDRSVEDRRRAQAVEPERGDHRVGLPMTAGGVIVQAGADRAAAITPQQVGRHATFVEKDVLSYIPHRLPGLPLATGRRDIRPALLVGVYRFF